MHFGNWILVNVVRAVCGFVLGAAGRAIIGNQVRILNSPAAVLTSNVLCSMTEQPLGVIISEKAKYLRW